MASDPIRILIVDDDKGALIALERLLEGEGYSTVTAWSAREAIALCERHQFHFCWWTSTSATSMVPRSAASSNEPSLWPRVCSCTPGRTWLASI